MSSGLSSKNSDTHPVTTSPSFASKFLSAESNVAVWAAVSANVIWGASFLASKVTLGSWSPLEASSLRFILATALLGGFSTLAGRKIETPKSRNAWTFAALAGLVGFGALYPLQLIGLTKIPSGVSAIVMQSSPILVLAFSFLISKEKLTRRSLLAIALASLASILLIANRGLNFGSTEIDFVGLGLTALAAVALALSVPINKKLTQEVGPLSATFWSMAIGTVTLIFITLISETPDMNKILSASSSAWVALGFLSLVCSALCFFLWNYAIKHTNSTVVAYSMQIKTPTAVIIGFSLGSETFGIATILAGILFGIGSWLVIYKPKAKA